MVGTHRGEDSSMSDSVHRLPRQWVQVIAEEPRQSYRKEVHIEPAPSGVEFPEDLPGVASSRWSLHPS